jgi:hypothetical protein
MSPGREPPAPGEPSSSVAAAVLDAALQDRAGAPTSLRRHLGARATVIVFLRHFG